MNSTMKQHFDFSLDAMAFKEQLAGELRLSHNGEGIEALEDDDLEFLNAAGTPTPAPWEDDLP